MNPIVGAMFALCLPTIAGVLVWCACFGRPRGVASWCAAAGTGHIVGAMGLGTLLSFFDGASSASILVWAGSITAIVAALAGAVVFRSARTHAGPLGEPWMGSNEIRVLGAIVFPLALLAVLLIVQDLLLPTLGWDAWNSWLAKSKAWFHNGALGPAVSLEAWGKTPIGSSITSSGWPYPEALPQYALWLALGAGQWNEGLVHLAWFGCWLALGLALFGHLRLLQATPTAAALATAGLLTLPMVTAHVALAGYADLWLATMLMLAAVHAHRWLATGARRDAAAALVCAALLPMIKAEGAVWLLCLLASTVLGKVRMRTALFAVAGAVAVWAVALPWGGLRLPLPALGWVRMGWGEIEMANLGRIELAWQSVGNEVLQTLFLLPNWSLLWYVAPIVAWLGWRAIPGRPALRMLTWFVALGLAFLSVLFFFTDASAWAENFTSVNRVLMHLVPALAVWLSLLWARRGPRGTDRSSAA